MCRHNKSISEQSVELFPQTIGRMLVIKHCNVCKKVWVEDAPKTCSYITDHYIVWDGAKYSCAVCGLEFEPNFKESKNRLKK